MNASPDDAAPQSPTPGAGDAVTLDAAALARLRELDPDGRHGVVVRVLTAFDTSLRRILGQLEAQRVDGDAKTVCDVAHTLKSSSASIGALELARSCHEVEQRIRSGAAGDLATEVRRLIGDGQAALAAVEAMLRS